MKRILTVLAVVAILASLLAVPVAAEPQARSYLIIATEKLPAKLAEKVSAAGGTLTTAIPEIGVAVASSSDLKFAAKAAKISGVRSVVSDVRVQWITPNYYQEAVEVEYGNPPYSGDNDTRFDLQWGHDAVDAPEAWNLGFRGEGARVAVLDTGFDTDHPDLAPNINFDLSANFTDEPSLTYALPDAFSHGSHVAGTIAAADNAFGTIGVAPEAELVLVKVMVDDGWGQWDWLMQGIVYAANVDADVINMSLGGYFARHGYLDDNGTPDDPSDDYWVGANEIAELLVALGRATTYAYQQGTTLIAAAGNDSLDFDHSADWLHVPAGSPHVISIAATAPIGWGVDPTVSLDNSASYSNYGQSAIDFAAPGGDYMYYFVDPVQLCTVAGVTRPCYVFDYVFSTGSSLNPAIASYYWGAGTSMAAPHASGVAAIVIGANGGDMPPAQVEAALRASADDLGKPGNDDFYGLGRVNAGNYFPE